MKRIHFKKTLKTHFKKNPFLAVVFSRPKSFFFKYIFSKFNWDFFLPEEWNILELVISFFFNLKYIWILQAIYRHDSDNSIMEFDFFFCIFFLETVLTITVSIQLKGHPWLDSQSGFIFFSWIQNLNVQQLQSLQKYIAWILYKTGEDNIFY